MTLGDIIPWTSGTPRKRHATDDVFGDFFRDIEQFFDRGWKDLTPTNTPNRGRFIPTLNVEEKEKEYVVTAELPGMDEKEVNVEVTDDYLTISGEKKSTQEKKEGAKCYVEHSYGAFTRRIALPADVDREGAEATMKKGVLTLKLPKSVEAKAATKKLKIRQDD